MVGMLKISFGSSYPINLSVSLDLTKWYSTKTMVTITLNRSIYLLNFNEGVFSIAKAGVRLILIVGMRFTVPLPTQLVNMLIAPTKR